MRRDLHRAKATPSFWRLPGIRHGRYLVNLHLVKRHHRKWRKLGRFSVNADRDYAVLDAIWRGEL